ncbi:LON peptidase substrate-binding domain-containing protein [Pseudobdellovibrio sp. HCB154]|uniref:LON peptidase substrate-binding domain-containing protein n=1 Tax=Pseudobdellovibrio sp. HCB154 TaxID=3386277 RepID=UPI0039172147
MKCFVFPLTHANLFPLTTKPLNIFEPRYLQMVEDSLETKTPIALAYVPENGDTYRSIAGFGLPQVIDQRPNDTLLIFLPGQGKIRILQEDTSDTKPYLIAECEIVVENLEVDESLKPKYMTLSKLLVQWVQKHIPDAEQRDIFIRSLKGPQEIVSAFAAYLIRDYDLQYEMMEIFNINDQIRYLHRLYESNELTI